MTVAHAEIDAVNQVHTRTRTRTHIHIQSLVNSLKKNHAPGDECEGIQIKLYSYNAIAGRIHTTIVSRCQGTCGNDSLPYRERRREQVYVQSGDITFGSSVWT